MNQKKINIGAIGEALWDIQGAYKTFGGAPANFACHCAGLGANAFLISSIGNDNLGQKSLHFLKEQNVNCSGIHVDSNKETGVVNVLLDENGIPSYEIKEHVAWDFIPFQKENLAIIDQLDVLCFGSLAQRHKVSEASIQNYLKATPLSCLKVFDINIRQSFYSKDITLTSLEKTDILKLNDEELPILSAMLNIDGDAEHQLQTIMERFDLKLAILTMGSKGSLMMTPDEISYSNSFKAIEVASTVGAGDAFTAATIMAFLNKKPLAEINQYANSVAAFVCTQTGAVPQLTDSLKIDS